MDSKRDIFPLQTPLVGAPRSGAGLTREFLGWDELFLRKVADRLVDAYEAADALVLRDTTVVVPGGRAGRRLKELLLARSEAAGKRLVLPRIITIGELPELLYAARKPFAGKVLQVRAWTLALQRLGARISSIFPHAPGGTDLLGWTRLATVVQRLHQDVTAAGLGFLDVANRVEAEFLDSEADRWRLLAEVQVAYRDRLADWGYADRPLARMEALQSGVVAAPNTEVWLAGVVEMPEVTAAMLRTAARGARITALIDAPRTEADGFDSVGRIAPTYWARRPVPLARAQIEIVGPPDAQADVVVDWLRRLDGRYRPEEIVIAAPSTEVHPFLEQRLAAAGVPVRRAVGAPVFRTPAPRLLSALADYLESDAYEAMATLARHPDAVDWLERGGAVRVLAGELDQYFTWRLPLRFDGQSTPPSRRGTHTTRAVREAIAERARALDLQGTRTLAAWMSALMDLLLEVYGDRPLDRNVPEQRELLESLATLRTVAGEVYALPAAADETCTSAEAIRVLLELVGTETLTPRADDAAVELMGWLEVHLDDAPVVFVTGANDGLIPEAVNAHPFLPDALRSRLGLVDNARRYARDAYQMTALAHSRDVLRVVSGRRSAAGDPLRPSRLLFAVTGEELALRVRGFYADQPEPRPLEEAVEGVAPRTGFVLPPEPVISAPQPIELLSVSRFGGFLVDPYRSALEIVRGLRSVDDSLRELDGARFGGVAHAVLEAYGRDETLRDSADPAAIAAFLDGELDRVFDETFGPWALPAVRLQAEQLRARLQAFARWQAARRAAGWRIVGVELSTPQDQPAPFPVDGGDFGITGRIDRIDRHEGTGEIAIFDYKTGDRGEPPEKTHRKNGTWIDLQLPLYRHLLPHVVDSEGQRPFGGAIRADRLGYILLPRDADKVGEAFGDWSDEELAEADEAARSVVELIRANEFRWNPETASVPYDEGLAAVLGFGYLEAAIASDEVDDDAD